MFIANCDIVYLQEVNIMTRLREARENSGLRREFVAEKLGISPDHLSLIERGKRTSLSLKRIETLANLYNVTFEEMARAALETAKEAGKIE